MQDASDHGNSTFTVKEARALRARFISLVLERDELSAELEAHRLVLAELEELRQFLADDPAPFTAVAATNGHLHAAQAQADDDLSDTDVEPEPDDTTFELDAAQAEDDRATMAARSQLCTGEPSAARDRDETDAERRGETDAGDANLYNPLVSADRNQADDAAASEADTPPADGAAPEPDTPAVVEAAERQGEQASGETGTAQRPPQGSLMERILTAIEQSDKPRRGWHLQKQLGLPRVPTPELSRLVQRGFLTRHGESIYGVAGREYGSSKSW